MRKQVLALVALVLTASLLIAPSAYAAVSVDPASPGVVGEDTDITVGTGNAIRIYRSSGSEVVGSASNTLSWSPNSPLIGAYIVEYDEYGQSPDECDNGPLAECLASADYISHIRYTWQAGEDYEHPAMLENTDPGDIIGGFGEVVTANILPILGMLGFAWGVYWILKRVNRAKASRV